MNRPTMTMWRMNFSELGSYLGSRDAELLAALGRPGDPPELAAAAHSLVMRAPPYAGNAQMLMFVLADLVTVVGQRLPDNAGIDLEMSVLTAADAQLAASGIPFKISSLIFRGPPVQGFPAVEALPMIGHATADEVKAIHAVMESKRPRSTTRAVDGLLGELGDWLALAAAHGEGLVGVYS